MGELSEVLGLLGGAGMSDQDIVRVVNPSLVERQRNLTKRSLPEPEDWRYSPSVGRLLTQNFVVRANHFRCDVSCLAREIYHYHVHFYRISLEGERAKEDCAGEEDYRILTGLMLRLRANHSEWELTPDGKPMGFTYDGKSALFTSAPLPFTQVNDRGEPVHAEDVALLNADGSTSRKQYTVQLTLIATQSTLGGINEAVMRCLDTALFAFARWMVPEDTPAWHIIGNKLFRASDTATSLSNAYLAMRGYYAGLKVCKAGLVLVSDLSVSCVLQGGPMLELMASSGGFRDIRDMLDACRRGQGLHGRIVDQINGIVKGCKCRLLHLGHTKKVKGLGPPAGSRETEFVHEGVKKTVAEYFEFMARNHPAYTRAVGPDGRLLYPDVPTINIGSKNRPVLVPPDLIFVPGGQSRARKMTGEMVSAMIKMAAVRPDERFKFLEGNGGESIVKVVKGNPSAIAFGLGQIQEKPMAVDCRILPQAKIRYAGEKVVDPQLNGSWAIDRPQVQFIEAPPASVGGEYLYGVALVGDNPPRGNFEPIVTDFCKKIESDASAAGIRLRCGGSPLSCRPTESELSERLSFMRDKGARIVLVVMITDCYNVVKIVGDTLGIETQCLKWKNVERSPRGYHANVMLKINTKMGGINHTLVSRGKTPAANGPIFQKPPASLCWLFDRPCMYCILYFVYRSFICV